MARVGHPGDRPVGAVSDRALDAHRALIDQLATPQLCPACRGRGRCGRGRCEPCLGSRRVLQPRTCAGCSGVLRPRVGEPLSVFARRSACNRLCGARTRPAPPSRNGNGGPPPERAAPRLTLTKVCAGCPAVFGPYAHETASHFATRRHCSKSCWLATNAARQTQKRQAAESQIPPCRACGKPLHSAVKSGLHLECRGTERAFPLHFPGADLATIAEAPTTCQRCGSAGLQTIDEGLVCRVCSKRIRIVECLAALARRGVGRS